MRSLILLAVLSGTAVGVYRDDPTANVASEDGPPQVRFPDGRQAPGPVPVNSATLTPDLYYVIDADIDGIVLARPSGLVRVTKESGPLRLRGKFIDGTGKIETRNYKGSNLFMVDAVGTGTVDLLFIPFGFKTESEIVSRTVRVDAGMGPQPPPEPDPDPKPKPDPDPAPPKAESVWVIVVEETSARTPDIARVLNDKAYWDTVTARGHKWRIYDRDNDEARKYGYAARADKIGLPAVILYDVKQGNHLKTFRLPATTAGIDAEIKAVTK